MASTLTRLMDFLRRAPRASRGALLSHELNDSQMGVLREAGRRGLLLAHGSGSDFSTPRASYELPFYLTDDPLFASTFTDVEDLPYLHLFGRPQARFVAAPWEEPDLVFRDARRRLAGPAEPGGPVADELRRILAEGFAETGKYVGHGVGWGDRGAAEIVASPVGVRRLRRFADGGNT